MTLPGITTPPAILSLPRDPAPVAWVDGVSHPSDRH